MPMLNSFSGLGVERPASLAATLGLAARLHPLGQSRPGTALRLRGDRITAGQMGALGVPWGGAAPATVDALLPGWSWEWDVAAGTLTVTDASGATSTRRASTWSGLLLPQAPGDFGCDYRGGATRVVPVARAVPAQETGFSNETDALSELNLQLELLQEQNVTALFPQQFDELHEEAVDETASAAKSSTSAPTAATCAVTLVETDT